MLEKILNEFAANTKPNEHTYLGDNGLLHCAKHKMPVQVELDDIFNGGKRIINCMCRGCRAELDEAEEREKQAQVIAARRKAAFPDDRMASWNFENDDKSNKPISDALLKYASNFEQHRKDGKGLVLFGTVGTGKTFYAACVVNKLLDLGYRACLTNLATIVNKVQENFEGRQAYIDSLNRYDLLVIDDLGTEAGTEYRQEILFNVIDNRYQAGLPLLITTNLKAQDFKKPKHLGFERISDRLLECCIFIELSGESRRRQKCRREQLDNMKALGL